jgi:hypothetical protein
MIALQFAAEDGVTAEIIKLYQRGWPSHVDAVMPDGSLLGARIENGVAIRRAGYVKFVKTEQVRLEVSRDPRGDAAFYDFLRQQLGKPYDVKAIVAFALIRDWRDPRAWFCSELIAAALEHCGFFPHPLSAPANEVTPRDLMMAVSPWSKT